MEGRMMVCMIRVRAESWEGITLKQMVTETGEHLQKNFSESAFYSNIGYRREMNSRLPELATVHSPQLLSSPHSS